MKSMILKTALFALLLTVEICSMSVRQVFSQKAVASSEQTTDYAAGGRGAEFAVFDGAYVWIANQFGDTVTKINSSTGVIAGNYEITGNPLGIAYDGRHIWVSRYASDDVVKMDVNNGAILATVKVNNGPGCLLAKDGHIWVVNRIANTVQKIPVDGTTVSATYKVGKKPAMIETDGANIWVANSKSHSVTRINIASGETATFASGGKGTFGIAFDGTGIWVSNFFSGNIVKFSGSGNLIGNYKIGDGVAGMYYAQGYMWVVANGESLVYRVRLSDGSIVSSHTVSPSPYGLLYDGWKFWIPSSGSGKISVVTPLPADVTN